MPAITSELPAPDAAARAHSERVGAAIAGAISKAGGAIPFSEYMRLALYAAGLGYYRAGTEKFGAAGDFVTAPEVSPLFGAVLARQAAEVLETGGGDTILELGAGSGRLALAVLRELAAADRLPERYLILEVSGELAARQQALLAGEPELASRVRWLDRLPGRPIRGVVLANEVADALPVECFRWDGDTVHRMGVGVDDGRFVWRTLPATPELRDRIPALASRYDWAPGYTSETCPELEPWIAALAGVLDHGALLLFDYGLPEHEYYHPDRRMGTLMCHYRHRAHDDPFLWPGLQDITAWVDFSALAAAARAAGLEVGGYTTQANFLVGGGIAGMLENIEDDVERIRLSGEIKRLILPSEMGEAFKVIALVRGAPPPSAFALRDLSARL